MTQPNLVQLRQTLIFAPQSVFILLTDRLFYFVHILPTLNIMQTYTAEQVAAHNNDKDCWIIVDNKVFDVTPFLSEHPGKTSTDRP
jgi:cytochrome b involved in lipid metabolism